MSNPFWGEDRNENELKIKKFDDISVEWLDTVRDNRKFGGIQHDFDVMIGPVANDNTMLTVTRYAQGTYTADEALKRLEYANVNDQGSFHTKKSLKSIRFIRRYTVE